MRIGTWNLDGRRSDRHVRLLRSIDCDVWLLTEVSDRLSVPGYTGTVTSAEMRSNVRWAGIFSRLDVEPLSDPHSASAMARVGGMTFVSSVLPWKGCGDIGPRQGSNHPERTRHTLDSLASHLPDDELC